jgi:hypothetical protein
MVANSCLYVGQVRHRRFGAVENDFAYSLFMAYIDLAELPELFRRRWFWSSRRPALARFRRDDHVGPSDRPLDTVVRDLVEERTGSRPAGPIRLLTHLRYFGHCFNPVSFYYCFDASGTRVDTIVAEVNNTPWGERHCYVLPAADARRKGPVQEFAFGKAFHVSPFLPMDMDYAWRFRDPGERLTVHMQNIENAERRFDATLTLDRRPMTAAAMAGVLLRFPVMTLKVITLIHVQALRLWLKGARFHPHPRKTDAAAPAAARNEFTEVDAR